MRDMNNYKTFEELKEELGDKFEEYMYKANIELLKKIDSGGFCELKKKCDAGLCDCTNEEYDSMAQCNMKLSLENENLHQRIDKAIEYLTSYNSIHTIQFGTENDSLNDIELNKTLDEKTLTEMTNRYLKVHDKLLEILKGDNDE